MNIKDAVKENFDDYISDLSRIISIDSISTGKKVPNNPRCIDCLNEALSICERDGFRTRNIDNVIGYAEWGPDTSEYYSCIAHLDVVPPKEGWNTDPFVLSLDGDKYVARGILDDKGPAMCTYYAIKILKKLKVEPKIKFRMIFGTNEECGSHEIPNYLKYEKVPAFCFTPDSEYPITYAEKGIANYKLKFNIKGNFKIEGDMNRNRIPDDIKFFIDDRLYHAKGVAAHTAWPYSGKNAILDLALQIMDSEESNDIKEFFADIYHVYNNSHNGENLGMTDFNFEIDPKQKLVVAPFKLEYEDGILSLFLSTRYPSFITEEDITKKICSYYNNAEVEITRSAPPAICDLENPNVKKLLQAYRDVTGDMSDPVNSSGGTYSKHLANTVAFGASFQNRPNVSNIAHNANEYMYIDDMYKNIEIYANAIYNLVICQNFI